MNESLVALKVDPLISRKVKNSKGETLGKVKELLIDYAAGDVAYVVLSYGGFLGLGSRRIAIPWEVLEQDPEHNSFVLDLEKKILSKIPGFSKNQVPPFRKRLRHPSWMHGEDVSSEKWQLTN
jgi:sporulation protein YlmC with PRC-barrel domain